MVVVVPEVIGSAAWDLAVRDEAGGMDGGISGKRTASRARGAAWAGGEVRWASAREGRVLRKASVRGAAGASWPRVGARSAAAERTTPALVGCARTALRQAWLAGRESETPCAESAGDTP